MSQVVNSITVENVTLDRIPVGSICLRLHTVLNGKSLTRFMEMRFDRNDLTSPVSFADLERPEDAPPV